MNKGNSKLGSDALSDGGMVAKLLKMQKQMRKTRANLAGETVTAASADGAVIVSVSGDQRVKEIRLEPELLAKCDSANLANILVAVINDAMEKSQTLAANRLQELTGGLGLPGQ